MGRGRANRLAARSSSRGGAPALVAERGEGRLRDDAAFLALFRALEHFLGALGLPRLCRSGQALLQLLLDLLGVLGLRLQGQRLIPLETGLALPAHPPVGVAEMVVEDRILGAQLHGALQMLCRLLEVAEAVVG